VRAAGNKRVFVLEVDFATDKFKDVSLAAAVTPALLFSCLGAAVWPAPALAWVGGLAEGVMPNTSVNTPPPPPPPPPPRYTHPQQHILHHVLTRSPSLANPPTHPPPTYTQSTAFFFDFSKIPARPHGIATNRQYIGEGGRYDAAVRCQHQSLCTSAMVCSGAALRAWRGISTQANTCVRTEQLFSQLLIGCLRWCVRVLSVPLQPSNTCLTSCLRAAASQMWRTSERRKAVSLGVRQGQLGRQATRRTRVARTATHPRGAAAATAPHAYLPLMRRKKTLQAEKARGDGAFSP
jgi:hypothetical protein